MTSFYGPGAEQIGLSAVKVKVKAKAALISATD